MFEKLHFQLQFDLNEFTFVTVAQLEKLCVVTLSQRVTPSKT